MPEDKKFLHRKESFCLSDPQWGDRWPDGDDALGFMEFRVTGEGIRERFVPLKEASSLQGYGPGGNPPEEGRDYSVAWDKPLR